jgi:hypothetical protein
VYKQWLKQCALLYTGVLPLFGYIYIYTCMWNMQHVTKDINYTINICYLCQYWIQVFKVIIAHCFNHCLYTVKVYLATVQKWLYIHSWCFYSHCPMIFPLPKRSYILTQWIWFQTPATCMWNMQHVTKDINYTINICYLCQYWIQVFKVIIFHNTFP